ncbi:hypothetical protein NFI96_028121, partial [Prochilodus magdalenae]
GPPTPSTASSPTASSPTASSPTALSPTASSPAVTSSQTKPGSSSASSAEMPDEPPPSLPFVPFALVTVILLHIIVAVVYYTSRTKGPARVHDSTADGDGVAALWRKEDNYCVSQDIQEEPPPSLPFVPFALVTVILLHIIVAVVYYTSRTKGCTLQKRGELIRITAHTGRSVLLPCSCIDLQTTPEELRWKKDINTEIYEEISRESGQYRNRVQLFNDHSPGNLSLLISHLTEKDGGEYWCAVKGSYTIIRLTVKEGPPTPSTASSPTASSPTASSPTASSPTASSPAVTSSQTKPGSSSASSAEMPDDKSSSKNLFIYILLLLLGLGGVGVIYWRCRGRRQGQAESQDQRRMKREQEGQHIDFVKDCNGVVPDCHGVKSANFGLMGTTNKSVCGGTVIRTKMNSKCHMSRKPGPSPFLPQNLQELC